MNNPFRVFLFTHYLRIIALAVVVAITFLMIVRPPVELSGNIGAICAGALGVIYFVQKQKNEDLQLFERLFTGFNKRYADMNAALRRCVDAEHDLNDKIVQKVLDDYFNLCAEEYLFYEQGRILPEVWRAWCRGICEYLKCPRIRRHWDNEVGQDSYYGLTSNIIYRGAGLLPQPCVSPAQA